MAYVFQGPIGGQPIATTDTTQRHPLGFTAFAYDPTYGQGKFIYLVGVASTVVGSLVTYNALSGATTLAPNTANLAQPVAVAMSANVASQYGWYQIQGAAVVKKTGVPVSPNVVVYLSGTAGRIKTTAASGKQILGARTANAATVVNSTSTVTVTINHPHCQGAVS